MELELGPTPPALADVNEYSDELDIRFDSEFTVELFLDIAGSGSWVCPVMSVVLAPRILGVSDSSAAVSLTEAFVPSVQASDMSDIDPVRLMVDEARDDSVA